MEDLSVVESGMVVAKDSSPLACPNGSTIQLSTLSPNSIIIAQKWAIVKDIEVAKKMALFVQSSTLGVAKESQTRAAKITGVICDGNQNFKSIESELFFEYSKRLMRERWEKCRGAVKKNKVFTVTMYPRAYCNFTNESSETYPSFAWLKCREGVENGKTKFSCKRRGASWC